MQNRRHENQPRRMSPGYPVQVRNRFNGAWNSGFEVAGLDGGGGQNRYRVRRVSDGVVLPEAFGRDEVTPERPEGRWGGQFSPGLPQ